MLNYELGMGQLICAQNEKRMVQNMNKDGKPHLSDIIDYDKDIAPYRLISIVSGVGSGKNTMVDHLVDGDLFCHQDRTKVEKQAVLLITSRRAKANEQLESEDAFYASRTYDDSFAIWYANDEQEKVYESDLPRVRVGDPETFDSFLVPKHSVAQTNARVETNLKWSYTPEDPLARPWERFDMIIVDEVHAILADASYQSAPYYVRRLIQETLKNSDTCKVIGMTGTPKILKGYQLFDNAHVINLMDRCVNVKPKKVVFISKDVARERQMSMLKKREKFVAFYNHVDSLLGVLKEYPKDVVASFSDEKKQKKLKKEDAEAYKRMNDVQAYLAKNKKLPPDVIGFLSTARNKEGISIENEDIRVMFTESHVDVDVIQMAGRLRNPVDVLYVVVDSEGYTNEDDFFEKRISKNKQILSGINEELKRVCLAESYPLECGEDVWRMPIYKKKKIAAYIDYIHKKFPYIRFDYFANRFVYYPERGISIKYYREQNAVFDEAKLCSKDLIDLARTWFPGIECSVDRSAIPHEEIRLDVERYLCANNWLDGKREIKKAERAMLLQNLNDITRENAKNLGSLLKRYGYELRSKTNSKKADAPYIIVAVEKSNQAAA